MKISIRYIPVFLFLFALSALTGCLSTTRTESKDDFGTIFGELPQYPMANLVLSSESSKRAITTDEQGRFSALVEPGRYQLLWQSSSGELVVIKRNLVIENNITLTVTDVDLIPMPRVTSVSVPMIYRNSAIIEWETDIESDGNVDYGTNELYGTSSYADTELKTRHRIQLYELQPATTYHFRIAASRYSLDSTRTLSRDYSFTTEP
ncbi:MAG: fibronectin type III domain-containing protein [Candidatus Rifleibacteriota bacterium]